MRLNAVKAKLANGECVVGTMVRGFVNAEVGPLLKRAGADFILIDTEHAPLGMESVALVCTSARLAGLVPVVRVPDAEYHLIARRLDAGAQGIMMPRVKTRADVEKIVRSAKYPPEGERGCGIRPILTGYESTGSLAGDLQWVNDDTLVCVQIETREAVGNLDDLLSVPGVDATILGPNDLSIALGVPGNHRSPVMEKAIDAMIAACSRHGVAPGIHTRSIEHLLDLKRRGMRLLACGTDEGFMLEGVRGAMASLSEAR